MEIYISTVLTRFHGILDTTVALLPNLILAAATFVLFLFVAKIGSFVFKRATRKYQESLVTVLGRLIVWVITILGAFVALSIVIPSFDLGDLITLLGIGGVAIGFAFRDILQNFLAGILILITEPFRIGDQIIAGNFEGTVTEIQTRATYIQTYDGRRVVIPNGQLFTESVTVNTAFPTRRSQFDLGIGYSDDIVTAERLILEAVDAVNGVLQDPSSDVLVVDFGDSSVKIRVRWWTSSRRADVLKVQDEVLTAVKEKLVHNGLDLPYPTQVVLFHDQTEETDGDRRRQREGWPAGQREAPTPARVSGSLDALAGAIRGRVEVSAPKDSDG